MEGFNFCYQVRVRYSEIDGQRLVFNSHYLTYISWTFIEYWRQILGCHYEKFLQYNQFEPVLIKSILEFVKPARLDNKINIFCRAERLGKSSMTFDFALVRESDGELLAKSKNIYVSVDLDVGKSRPIPSEIRQRIVEYEGGSSLNA